MPNDDIYFASVDITDVFPEGRTASSSKTRFWSDTATLGELMEWAEEFGREGAGQARLVSDVRVTVNEEEAERRRAAAFEEFTESLRNPAKKK